MVHRIRWRSLLKNSDLQHALFLRTFDDRLGFAPPCKPDAKVQHVLDVGTGTGIWVMDYADDHPSAEVCSSIVPCWAPINDFRLLESTCLPFSPACMAAHSSFPRLANNISVPPNVRFIIDDIEEEWQYSSKFDYIHSRMMNSSVADWESYATKIFECGSSHVHPFTLQS
jgi:hypothetical protein